MAKAIPKFTYTGSCETSSDNTYWYIKLKSSGNLSFTYAKVLDVFLVGGGGSSGTNWCAGGGGNSWEMGGNVHSNIDGKTNTGGGGGSGTGVNTGNTGGIIIVRGTQDDYLPIIYNGTRIYKLIYNGTTITSLIYNGTKLF